jgi:hypothetical protein
VLVIDGPPDVKGKSGVIKHIFRSFAFVFSGEQFDNHGSNIIIAVVIFLCVFNC